MNIFWNRFKIFIVIILALILVVFVVWMVAIPLLEMIRVQTSEIQKKSIEIEDKQRRLGEIGDLKIQHEFLASQRNNINVFITRESAVEAIELIEKISKETENEIVINISENEELARSVKKAQITLDNKKSIISGLPKKEFIKMDIELLGSYKSLYNFLRKAETMKYLGDIISIKTQVEEADLGPAESSDIDGENNSEFKANKSIRHLSTKISMVFYLSD